MPRRAILLACAAAASCERSPSPPLAREAAIEGWFLSGSRATQFRAFTDHRVAHGGSASACIETVEPDVTGTGTLMQAIPATQLRGKRVRFSAFVKTDGVTGWAGLWMRVDRPTGRVAFDNMQDRAIFGTTSWTRHEVVLDVADDASAIAFGLIQNGAGTSHLDDAALEPVGAEVAVTATDPRPRTLQNSDFERGGTAPDSWVLTGYGDGDATVTLDFTMPQQGAASARIERRVSQLAVPSALQQSLRADGYRGKRLRISGWFRGAQVKAARLSVQVRAAGTEDNLGRAACALPTGTFGWQPCEIVVDVPEAAETIDVAAALEGKSLLWLDHVELAEVGRDVPLSPPPEPALRPANREPGAPAPSQEPPAALANGDFELGPALPGWFMSGGASEEFEPAIDLSERAGGMASARLRPRVAAPSGYGTLMQSIRAEPFRGKRVQLRAQVKGAQITGRGDLWVRVQAAYSPDDGPGLGGGGCKLSQSFGWKPCVVVFDVPDEGESIQLGVGLAGPGTIWLDQVSLREVSRDVPVTSKTRPRTLPVNLDFEAVPRR